MAELKLTEDLIARLDSGECSNELDMAIEIALFDPDVSVRPNAAGTKLIYTKRSGKEATFMAADWSMQGERARTIMRLRAALTRTGGKDD